MPSLVSPLGSEQGERYSNSLALALQGEWTLQLGPSCHSFLYMPFRGASQDLEPWDLPFLAPNSRFTFWRPWLGERCCRYSFLS